MNANNVNYNLEQSPVGMGIRKIAQVVGFKDFTDGGSTVGTLTMKDQLPLGAFVIGAKVTVKEAFNPTTSCVLKIGKSSGEDEFTYGNVQDINIFTTGNKQSLTEAAKSIIEAAQSVYLHATGGANWSTCTAGKMLVEIFYLSTVTELLNPGVDKLNW